MLDALKIIAAILVIAFAVGGAAVALAFVGSFINRIGNPYDQW